MPDLPDLSELVHFEETPMVTERLRPLFAEAIARAAAGSKYEWELSLSVVPTPPAGELVPAAIVVVWVPSPILSTPPTWLRDTTFITDPQVTAWAGVNNVVRSAFERLAQTRTKVLSDIAHGQNGNGGPRR